MILRKRKTKEERSLKKCKNNGCRRTITIEEFDNNNGLCNSCKQNFHFVDIEISQKK